MAYLFEVSIGPVQSFIASARRTGDLYFGSHLLSELAKAAANEIVVIDKYNSLIFPSPDSPDDLKPNSPLIVANKIVAYVQTPPQDLGEKVEKAISKRLHEIKNEASKKLNGLLDNAEMAEAQLDDLVEYYWVAVPYEAPNYAHARKKLEALMAARKNTRSYQPITWGKNKPKSSIDGQLESVIPEGNYPHYKDKPEAKQAKIQKLYTAYHAGPAERLSGVDLLKRLGASADDFSIPGTSHFAAIPYLTRLQTLDPSRTNDAIKKWKAYITEAERLAPNQKIDSIPNSYQAHNIIDRVEGSLLFEERLVDLVGDLHSNNSKQIEPAKKALRQFYTFIDENLPGKYRPDPYYAILSADGDQMGKTIDMLAQQGEERHSALSKKLDSFAKSVKGVVEQHHGALIYAGGDDVLAFLPLHTTLTCAQALSNNFKKKLASFTDADGKAPTLSVGITIVHHLQPLWEALGIARATEQKAKHVEGKNALAITVRKRSGGEYSVAGQWGELDAQIKTLVHYAIEDALSSGTAYELRDMWDRLNAPPEESDRAHMREIIHVEMKRILQRKLQISENTPAQHKAREILASLLVMLDSTQPSEPATQAQRKLSPSS